MKSQRLATALVAAYRLLTDAPSEGRRRLFDAVNEAFVFVASEAPFCPSCSRERADVNKA